MIGRFEPGPRREKLGFQPAVHEAFGFLLEIGFEVVRDEVTFVRFESERHFVNVYHGRGSFELGVEFGRLADPSTHFRLPAVLRVLAPAIQEQAVFQASTGEAVHNCVGRLGTLVREHCKDLWSSGPALWEEIERQQSAAAVEETEKYTLRPIRQKAEQAWHEKNYKDVVELYGQMLDALTEVEMKRLEYAKKQSN